MSAVQSSNCPSQSCDAVDRIRAERALSSELDLVLTAGHDINQEGCVAAFNLSGVVTYAAPAVEALFGIAPEEAVGQPWDMIVPWLWTSVRVGREIESDLVHNQTPCRPFIMQFFTIDGDRKSVQIWAVPVLDETGQVVGVAGLMREETSARTQAIA